MLLPASWALPVPAGPASGALSAATTSRNRVNLLHRSTWPALLRLGWPVSATLMVRVTMRTVDLLVVGRVVGAAGVAALGIGDAAARLVLFTALGLGAGTIATVSQAVGRRDPDDARRATTQSAVLAAAMGVPFTIVGLLTAPWFFEVLGAEPEVVEIGTTYLRVIIATAVPRMVAIVLTRAFQGAGDTRTPLVIRTIGTVLNIALTVVLVPGLWGAPELGVLGAAIGTAAGNVASALILIGALTINGQRASAERAAGRSTQLDASALGFTRSGIWAPALAARLLRIGWPQMVERNLYGIAALPLNAIVLTFGTAANAGFHVGRRVMLYGLLLSRGIATATSTKVGNATGAGDPERAEHNARGGIALSTLIGAVVAVPVFVFAEPLARVFLTEEGSLGAATVWVQVHAGVTVLRAGYGTIRGIFQGTGVTRPPLVSSATGLGVFALGFSWLVGVQLGAGLWAVYLGVLLDPLARTAMLYRWFEQDRWKLPSPQPTTPHP